MGMLRPASKLLYKKDFSDNQKENGRKYLRRLVLKTRKKEEELSDPQKGKKEQKS